MPPRGATAAGAGAGNGEVSVEKVDRIGYVVYTDAVTRPSVYGNPRPATVTKNPAVNVAISRKNSGTTLIRGGVASPEDIDEYIAKKKWEFLHGV